MWLTTVWEKNSKLFFYTTLQLDQYDIFLFTYSFIYLFIYISLLIIVVCCIFIRGGGGKCSCHCRVQEPRLSCLQVSEVSIAWLKTWRHISGKKMIAEVPPKNEKKICASWWLTYEKQKHLHFLRKMRPKIPLIYEKCLKTDEWYNLCRFKNTFSYFTDIASHSLERFRKKPPQGTDCMYVAVRRTGQLGVVHANFRYKTEAASASPPRHRPDLFLIALRYQ